MRIVDVRWSLCCLFRVLQKTPNPKLLKKNSSIYFPYFWTQEPFPKSGSGMGVAWGWHGVGMGLAWG